MYMRQFSDDNKQEMYRRKKKLFTKSKYENLFCIKYIIET